MKSVRLLFSKNIFAVIFLKWGEQTVIEMKKNPEESDFRSTTM